MTKICILAGNYMEAETWARGQNLESNQWFFPNSTNDLLFANNFHTIVIGTAGQNVPASIFEKIYQLALQRGKVGRI